MKAKRTLKRKKAFPKAILAAIRDGQILGIRAGTKPHRIIGIWAVVKIAKALPHGRATAPEPCGVIEVNGLELSPIRPS